jgi:UDPglucose--hexose-1-phosphate uridylyltransferase
MLAEPQRDITPEQAAERLRGCNGMLYRKKLEGARLTNGVNGVNGVNGHH